MKTIAYLAVLLLNAFQIFSQTILTPASLSTYTIGGQSISFEDTTLWTPRVQSRFVLGYQWAEEGPDTNVSLRLKANFFHTHYGEYGTRSKALAYIPYGGVAKQIVWRAIGTDQPLYCEEQGIQFDPTAKVSLDTASPLRLNDTTRATFGFKYRISLTIRFYSGSKMAI